MENLLVKLNTAKDFAKKQKESIPELTKMKDNAGGEDEKQFIQQMIDNAKKLQAKNEMIVAEIEMYLTHLTINN